MPAKNKNSQSTEGKIIADCTASKTENMAEIFVKNPSEMTEINPVSVKSRPIKKRTAKTKSGCAKKLSVKKIASTEAFESHIIRIKKAKNDADKIWSCDGELDTARASLALMWELVFDRLCAAEDFSLSDFNTLAGVVQKLSASRTQMDNADAKDGQRAKNEGVGLTDEMLKKIEGRLKLL